MSSDDEWARAAVRRLLKTCFLQLAAQCDRHALALRRWAR
jgi:hypothetical protein